MNQELDNDRQLEVSIEDFQSYALGFLSVEVVFDW